MEKITDIQFTEDKLCMEGLVEKISCENCGALSLFIGTTRQDKDANKLLVELQYECYVEMAKKETLKICNELREECPEIMHIAVHHRLGSVPVKQASIMIAISSPHRVDSMKATERCMSTLKARVPIWKKEVYVDGSTLWMENRECTWKANGKGNETQSVDDLIT